MGQAIGPGDWVERDPHYRGEPEIPRERVEVRGEWPVIGRIYKVRAVGAYWTLEGVREHGLKLDGIVASIPGHPDAWWPTASFRPTLEPAEAPTAPVKPSSLTPKGRGRR